MFQKSKRCRLQTLIRLLKEQPYLGLQFAQVEAVSICRVKDICFWLLFDKGYYCIYLYIKFYFFFSRGEKVERKGEKDPPHLQYDPKYVKYSY